MANDRGFVGGLMQDVRSYERKLTLEEIYELHAMPAKSDLHPVSGYLEFRQGELNKSFIISARDDNEEEGEELFILKLVSCIWRSFSSLPKRILQQDW